MGTFPKEFGPMSDVGEVIKRAEYQEGGRASPMHKREQKME